MDDEVEIAIEKSGGEAQRNNPLFNFIAGGVGGSCAVMTGQPFDTVKVRLQTMPKPAPGQPPLYVSTVDCFKKTMGAEGFTALYKGMAAPLAGVAPLFAIFFAASSVGKKLQQKTPDEKLSCGQHAVAGALAGVCTTVIMVPGERIKCLLQVQQGAIGSGANQYAGPLDVVRQLYKEGGIRSIYRGTVATLARDVPASAAYLGVYEFLMRSLTSANADRNDLSPAKTLFAGGLAGIANWSVAIPQDTLKSRLQIAPEGMYPNGMRDVARHLIKEDGIFALYRGFTPIMLRAFPANAACFLGYECTMKALGMFSS